MRWSRGLVVGLGAVVVAGVAPGTTASVVARDADGAFRQAAGSCVHASAPHPVRRPRFVRRIATGETGWFASPGLADVTGNGHLEIVAPFYSTFVFDAKGHELGRGTATAGRVYAPEVVTDLDGDGVPDIV